MNQTSLSYIDNVIEYVEKTTDSNENQVFNLKLFLSREIEESRNRFFSAGKEDLKNSAFSPTKNTIILRSIHFIFDHLDKIDHPLNKIIKHLNYNLCLKYEKELIEMIVENIQT